MPEFLAPSDRPAIMGVLNVTPDSFSDGGRFADTDQAVARGLELVSQGADLVDVGGESTRPGAEPVPEPEELRRVVPVVRALASAGIPVSIDTMKPAVAGAGLEAGAVMVNDVSGLRDPDMVEVCAGAACHVCIMHMKGRPQTMQHRPTYDDVVLEVRNELMHAADVAEQSGIARSRIWLDPGIGFGKTSAHNWELLRRISELAELGYPVVVGVSRKAFLGRLLGREDDPAPIGDRAEAGLAVQCWAQWQGARMIRTHDPLAARRASLAIARLTRD